MDWVLVSNVATAVGVVVGAISVFEIGLQSRKNARINEAQFLLNLEELFQRHETVRRNLFYEGEWTKDGSGPSTVAEWYLVEDYMAFFTHCEILIQNHAVSKNRMTELFGYSAIALMQNEKIANEVEQESKYWHLLKDFYSRAQLFEKARVN
jgi:hypothetical protein